MFSKRVVYRLAISVLLLSAVACGQKKIELLTGLDENNANLVISALLSHGIQSAKLREEENLTVIIAEKDIAESIAILNAKGLPNANRQTLGEIFKKEGMISTPLEERARYIYALSQELEFTLSKIDYVVLTRVHIVLAERIAPGQPVQPASAAVFIKHKAQLDPDTVEKKVKRLVAASVPSLAENVDSKVTISFIKTEQKDPEISLKLYKGVIVKEQSLPKLKRHFIMAYLIQAALFIALCILIFFLYREKQKSLQQSV